MSAFDLLFEEILNICTWSVKKEDYLLTNKKKIYLFLFRLITVVPVYICIYIFSIGLVSLFGTTDLQNNDTIAHFYLSIILLLPLLLFLLLNIRREENISEKVLKSFLTFLIIKDSIFTNFFPIKAVLHFIGGVAYIFLSSLLSFYVILYSLNSHYKNFTYFSQDGNVKSLLLSLFILHTAIYFYILIYGSPEETEQQEFKKIRRKFMLWLFSMLITIVYVVISIFKGYTTVHPFYFIFIILIAMERTITNYKSLTAFLSSQGFYEECLIRFKGEN